MLEKERTTCTEGTTRRHKHLLALPVLVTCPVLHAKKCDDVVGPPFASRWRQICTKNIWYWLNICKCFGYSQLVRIENTNKSCISHHLFIKFRRNMEILQQRANSAAWLEIQQTMENILSGIAVLGLLTLAVLSVTPTITLSTKYGWDMIFCPTA